MDAENVFNLQIKNAWSLMAPFKAYQMWPFKEQKNTTKNVISKGKKQLLLIQCCIIKIAKFWKQLHPLINQTRTDIKF